MTRRSITLSLLLLLLVAVAGASAPADLPAPGRTVNDIGDLLGPSAENSLTRRLDHYRKISGRDLIVVTVPTPVGRDYADRLFEFWSPRRPGLARGLILIIGADGSAALVTGPRLRPALDRATTDRLSAPIDLEPGRRTAQRRFEAEIAARATAVIAALDPAETPASYRPPRASRAIAFFFFAGMLVFPWFAAISARAQSAPGGAYAGAMTGILMALIAGPALGVVLAAILVPVGFGMDVLITSHYRLSRQNGFKPAWWAGGNWP